MNFSYEKQTHEDLLNLRNKEREVLSEILKLICLVDSEKMYLKLGYKNLFQYLHKALGYDETASYRRMQAARLLRSVPDILSSVEAGNLNVTQLSQVETAIKAQEKIELVPSERKIEILKQIENKNKLETTKILTQSFTAYEPTVPSRSQIAFKKDEVFATFQFSEEQFKLLQQAKDLLGHSVPSGKLEDVILFLCHKEVVRRIGKSSSVEKIKHRATNQIVDKLPEQETNQIADKVIDQFTDQLTNQEIHKNATELVGELAVDRKDKAIHRSVNLTAPRSLNFKNKIPKARATLPIATKRHIFQKNHSQCQFRSSLTGRQCDSTFQLEIEHIKPIAVGGDDSLNNLTLLCRQHNHYLGQRIT